MVPIFWHTCRSWGDLSNLYLPWLSCFEVGSTWTARSLLKMCHYVSESEPIRVWFRVFNLDLSIGNSRPMGSSLSIINLDIQTQPFSTQTPPFSTRTAPWLASRSVWCYWQAEFILINFWVHLCFTFLVHKSCMVVCCPTNNNIFIMTQVII